MEVLRRFGRTRAVIRGHVCPANPALGKCRQCPRVTARALSDVPVSYRGPLSIPTTRIAQSRPRCGCSTDAQLLLMARTGTAGAQWVRLASHTIADARFPQSSDLNQVNFPRSIADHPGAGSSGFGRCRVCPRLPLHARAGVPVRYLRGALSFCKPDNSLSRQNLHRLL